MVQLLLKAKAQVDLQENDGPGPLRSEHPENEVGKNVTGLENEVGTPRQLRYVTNMVRSSYVDIDLDESHIGFS